MVFNVATVLITLFSITVFAVFVQILSAILARRKILKLIDQGYYFIEVQVRWRRKELRPIHPDNIDLSTGALRLATPISAAVF